MRVLTQPLRVWHALVVIGAALVVGAGGTAIALNGGDDAARRGGELGKSKYLGKSNGFSYYSRTISTAGGQQGGGGAKCRRKEAVVGGGAFPTGVSQTLALSAPSDSGDRGRLPDDGWSVAINNNDGQARPLVIYAICKS